MKNFRKSIIALATVAAMLIPSVAMAATITAEVDSSVAGNVYAGYYTEEGVLVKAEKGEAITAETASVAAETLPCTLTVTDEVATEITREDGAEVRKLVLTAKAEGKAFTFGTMLSYDNTKVYAIVPDYADEDATPEILKEDYEEYEVYPFSVGNYKYEQVGKGGAISIKTDELTIVGGKTTTVGNRTAAGADIKVKKDGTEALLKDGLVIATFYYRVIDGQKVDADTFRFETELAPGTILDEIGQEGKEYGLKFTGNDNAYKYGCWLNGVAEEDSITVNWDTPWAPTTSTKTITINDATAPAAYKYIKVFVWDDKQIAQCAPVDGTYNN